MSSEENVPLKAFEERIAAICGPLLNLPPSTVARYLSQGHIEPELREYFTSPRRDALILYYSQGTARRGEPFGEQVLDYDDDEGEIENIQPSLKASGLQSQGGREKDASLYLAFLVAQATSPVEFVGPRPAFLTKRLEKDPTVNEDGITISKTRGSQQDTTEGSLVQVTCQHRWIPSSKCRGLEPTFVSKRVCKMTLVEEMGSMRMLGAVLGLKDLAPVDKESRSESDRWIQPIGDSEEGESSRSSTSRPELTDDGFAFIERDTPPTSLADLSNRLRGLLDARFDLETRLHPKDQGSRLGVERILEQEAEFWTRSLDTLRKMTNFAHAQLKSTEGEERSPQHGLEEHLVKLGFVRATGGVLSHCLEPILTRIVSFASTLRNPPVVVDFNSAEAVNDWEEAWATWRVDFFETLLSYVEEAKGNEHVYPLSRILFLTQIVDSKLFATVAARLLSFKHRIALSSLSPHSPDHDGLLVYQGCGIIKAYLQDYIQSVLYPWVNDVHALFHAVRRTAIHLLKSPDYPKIEGEPNLRSSKLFHLNLPHTRAPCTDSWGRSYTVGNATIGYIQLATVVKPSGDEVWSNRKDAQAVINLLSKWNVFERLGDSQPSAFASNELLTRALSLLDLIATIEKIVEFTIAVKDGTQDERWKTLSTLAALEEALVHVRASSADLLTQMRHNYIKLLQGFDWEVQLASPRPLSNSGLDCGQALQQLHSALRTLACNLRKTSKGQAIVNLLHDSSSRIAALSEVVGLCCRFHDLVRVTDETTATFQTLTTRRTISQPRVELLSVVDELKGLPGHIVDDLRELACQIVNSLAEGVRSRIKALVGRDLVDADEGAFPNLAQEIVDHGTLLVHAAKSLSELHPLKSRETAAYGPTQSTKGSAGKHPLVLRAAYQDLYAASSEVLDACRSLLRTLSMRMFGPKGLVANLSPLSFDIQLLDRPLLRPTQLGLLETTVPSSCDFDKLTRAIQLLLQPKELFESLSQLCAEYKQQSRIDTPLLLAAKKAVTLTREICGNAGRLEKALLMIHEINARSTSQTPGVALLIAPIVARVQYQLAKWTTRDLSWIQDRLNRAIDDIEAQALKLSQVNGVIVNELQLIEKHLEELGWIGQPFDPAENAAEVDGTAQRSEPSISADSLESRAIAVMRRILSCTQKVQTTLGTHDRNIYVWVERCVVPAFTSAVCKTINATMNCLFHGRQQLIPNTCSLHVIVEDGTPRVYSTPSIVDLFSQLVAANVWPWIATVTAISHMPLAHLGLHGESDELQPSKRDVDVAYGTCSEINLLRKTSAIPERLNTIALMIGFLDETLNEWNGRISMLKVIEQGSDPRPEPFHHLDKELGQIVHKDDDVMNAWCKHALETTQRIDSILNVQSVVTGHGLVIDCGKVREYALYALLRHCRVVDDKLGNDVARITAGLCEEVQSLLERVQEISQTWLQGQDHLQVALSISILMNTCHTVHQLRRKFVEVRCYLHCLNEVHMRLTRIHELIGSDITSEELAKSAERVESSAMRYEEAKNLTAELVQLLLNRSFNIDEIGVTRLSDIFISAASQLQARVSEIKREKVMEESALLDRARHPQRGREEAHYEFINAAASLESQYLCQLKAQALFGQQICEGAQTLKRSCRMSQTTSLILERVVESVEKVHSGLQSMVIAIEQVHTALFEVSAHAIREVGAALDRRVCEQLDSALNSVDDMALRLAAFELGELMPHVCQEIVNVTLPITRRALALARLLQAKSLRARHLDVIANKLKSERGPGTIVSGGSEPSAGMSGHVLHPESYAASHPMRRLKIKELLCTVLGCRSIGDIGIWSWDLDTTAELIDRAIDDVKEVIRTAELELPFEKLYYMDLPVEWDRLEFRFEPEKDLHVPNPTLPILRNAAEIVRKLATLRNQIKVASRSFGHSIFARDAELWSEQIGLAAEFLAGLMDQQKAVVEMCGIFPTEIASGTIASSKEAMLFQESFSQTKSILDLVKMHSNLGELWRKISPTGVRGMTVKLHEIGVQLEEVRTITREIVDRERRGSARLLFMPTDEILKLLASPHACLERLNAIGVQKLFPGIHSLLLEQDERATPENTSLVCTGFCSPEGETVFLLQSLNGSLSSTYHLNHLIQDLEASIRKTLCQCATHALEVGSSMRWDDPEAENIRNFSKWASHFPNQIVINIMKAQWTDVVEKALNSGGTKQAIITLQNVVKTMTRVVDSLLDEASQEKELSEQNELPRRFVHFTPECAVLRRSAVVTELYTLVDVTNEVIREISKCPEPSIRPCYAFHRAFKVKCLLESSPPKLRMRVSIGSFDEEYGFEYLGVYEPLVSTALTRRAMLAVAESLVERRVGSPSGPAGTGKTETVKALGRSIGKPVLVINCDDSFDAKSTQYVLSGVCRLGAWVCFDEFNRLRPRDLSTVSELLYTIQVALRERLSTVDLVESFQVSEAETDPRLPTTKTVTEPVTSLRGIKLRPDTGVFVTRNPTYIGRSELPDNLKRLLREISMHMPDTLQITRLILRRIGLPNDLSSKLASALADFFKSLDKALPKERSLELQLGLRAMKSILHHMSCCLNSRQLSKSDNTLESICFGIALESLATCILPRIGSQRVLKVVLDIVQQCFHEYQDRFALRRSDQLETAFRETLTRQFLSAAMETENRLLHSFVIDRLFALHACITSSTAGILIHGPAGSGKRKILDTWAESVNSLLHCTPAHDFDQESMIRFSQITEIKVHRFYTDAMTKIDLFGEQDPLTLEWRDGLFTQCLREVLAECPSQASSSRALHLLVFVGSIDSDWAESLNSVLDDSRVFTLPSGDRLPLPWNAKVIFETDTIRRATLATVSRCSCLVLGHDYRIPLGAILWNRFATHLLSAQPEISSSARIYLPFLQHLANSIDPTQSQYLRLESELHRKTGSKPIDPNHLDTKSVEIGRGLLAAALEFLCCLLSKDPSSFAIRNSLELLARALVYQPSGTSIAALAHLTSRITSCLGSALSPSSRRQLAHVIYQRVVALATPEIADALGICTATACQDDDFFIRYRPHELNSDSPPWIRWEPFTSALDSSEATSVATYLEGKTSLIPTMETLQYSELLEACLLAHHEAPTALLLYGPPDAGKRTLVKGFRKEVEAISPQFSSIRAGCQVITLVCNPSTTKDHLISLLSAHCKALPVVREDEARAAAWELHPASVDEMIIILDDVSSEVTSSQSADIEAASTGHQPNLLGFINQVLDEGGFWIPCKSRLEVMGARFRDQYTNTILENCFLKLRHIQFCAVADVSVSGMRPSHYVPAIIPYSLRNFVGCYVAEPSEDSLRRIYRVLLWKHAKGASGIHFMMCNSMAQQMIEVLKLNNLVSSRVLTAWVNSMYQHFNAFEEHLKVKGRDFAFSRLVQAWALEAFAILPGVQVGSILTSAETLATQYNLNARDMGPLIEEALNNKLIFVPSAVLRQHYDPDDEELRDLQLLSMAEVTRELESQIMSFTSGSPYRYESQSLSESYFDPASLLAERLQHMVMTPECISAALRVARSLPEARSHFLLFGPSGVGKRLSAQLGVLLAAQSLRTTRWYVGMFSERMLSNPSIFMEVMQSALTIALRQQGRISFIIHLQDVDRRSERSGGIDILSQIRMFITEGEWESLFPDLSVRRSVTSSLATLLESNHAEDRGNVTLAISDQLHERLHFLFTVEGEFDSTGSFSNSLTKLAAKCMQIKSVPWTHSSRFELIQRKSRIDVDGLNEWVGESLMRSGLELTALSRVTSRYTQFFSERYEHHQREQLKLKQGTRVVNEARRLVASLQIDLKRDLELIETQTAESNIELTKAIEAAKDAQEAHTATIQLADEIKAKTQRLETNRSDIRAAMAEAEPALRTAQEAVSALGKADIDQVSRYISPPSVVKSVVTCVMMVMGMPVTESPDLWNQQKAVLRRPGFIREVMSLDASKLGSQRTSTVRDLLARNPELTIQRAAQASAACGELFKWVLACLHYSEAVEKTLPLRQQLDELERELGDLNAKHAELQQEAQLAQSCADNARMLYSQTEARIIQLKSQAGQTQARLEKATRLTTALEAEAERWMSRLNQIEDKDPSYVVEHLQATSLVDALVVEMFARSTLDIVSLTAQLSAFSQHLGGNNLRLVKAASSALCSEAVQDDVIGSHLQPSRLFPSGKPDDFELWYRAILGCVQRMCPDAKERYEWHNNGLPSDEASKIAAACVTRLRESASDRQVEAHSLCPRGVLLVDETGLGIHWIQTQTKALSLAEQHITLREVDPARTNAILLSIDDNEFEDNLASAVRFGATVLIRADVNGHEAAAGLRETNFRTVDSLAEVLVQGSACKSSLFWTRFRKGKERINPAFRMILMVRHINTQEFDRCMDWNNFARVTFTLSFEAVYQRLASLVLSVESPEVASLATKRALELKRLRMDLETAEEGILELLTGMFKTCDSDIRGTISTILEQEVLIQTLEREGQRASDAYGGLKSYRDDISMESTKVLEACTSFSEFAAQLFLVVSEVCSHRNIDIDPAQLTLFEDTLYEVVTRQRPWLLHDSDPTNERALFDLMSSSEVLKWTYHASTEIGQEFVRRSVPALHLRAAFSVAVFEVFGRALARRPRIGLGCAISATLIDAVSTFVCNCSNTRVASALFTHTRPSLLIPAGSNAMLLYQAPLGYFAVEVINAGPDPKMSADEASELVLNCLRKQQIDASLLTSPGCSSRVKVESALLRAYYASVNTDQEVYAEIIDLTLGYCAMKSCEVTLEKLRSLLFGPIQEREHQARCPRPLLMFVTPGVDVKVLLESLKCTVPQAVSTASRQDRTWIEICLGSAASIERASVEVGVRLSKTTTQPVIVKNIHLVPEWCEWLVNTIDSHHALSVHDSQNASDVEIPGDRREIVLIAEVAERIDRSSVSVSTISTAASSYWSYVHNTFKALANRCTTLYVEGFGDLRSLLVRLKDNFKERIFAPVREASPEVASLQMRLHALATWIHSVLAMRCEVVNLASTANRVLLGDGDIIGAHLAIDESIRLHAGSGYRVDHILAFIRYRLEDSVYGSRFETYDSVASLRALVRSAIGTDRMVTMNTNSLPELPPWLAWTLKSEGLLNDDAAKTLSPVFPDESSLWSDWNAWIGEVENESKGTLNRSFSTQSLDVLAHLLGLAPQVLKRNARDRFDQIRSCIFSRLQVHSQTEDLVMKLQRSSSQERQISETGTGHGVWQIRGGFRWDPNRQCFIVSDDCNVSVIDEKTIANLPKVESVDSALSSDSLIVVERETELRINSEAAVMLRVRIKVPVYDTETENEVTYVVAVPFEAIVPIPELKRATIDHILLRMPAIIRGSRPGKSSR